MLIFYGYFLVKSKPKRVDNSAYEQSTYRELSRLIVLFEENCLRFKVIFSNLFL